MMDVYDYIASSNPYLAKQIINNFGYKVVNTNDMGGNLRMLVAQQGEEALKVILNNHPDKDILLELFSEKEPKTEKDCGCNNANHMRNQGYFNASGEQPDLTAKKVDNNFSIVFLAGIMVLSVAIISK
jgi:hypothetical protein